VKIELDNNLFAHVVGGSTGPQMGLMWFSAELHGVEKSHRGKILTFEEWAEESDFPLEEPEHIYIELDAEAGKTRAQLQTVIHEEEVARPRKTEGGPSESIILFYEATTDVKGSHRASEALRRAVEDAVQKWTRAPFGSGRQGVVTREQRLQQTEKFIEDIFQPTPGFFGVDP
jgi:hypothetical protein